MKGGPTREISEMVSLCDLNWVSVGLTPVCRRYGHLLVREIKFPIGLFYDNPKSRKFRGEQRKIGTLQELGAFI